MATSVFSRRRAGARAIAGAALLASVAAPAAGQGALLPLGPGAVTGQVNTYTVKPGDRLPAIAAFHGVHPIRITRPSAGALRDGLETGEPIFIDQRRILPSFQPWVDGIVLNIPEAHVYLLERGQVVKDYPVAVSDPDWQAPIGQFKVVDMEKHPTWHVPPEIQEEMRENGQEVKTKVPPGPENPLGPRWIGFADGTYGFHGTTAPTSIKTYSSHGCVRFLNAHITDLYDRVSLGTPVRVYYQPVLLSVDHDAVWLSAYPDVYGRDIDYRAAVNSLAETARVGDRLDWKRIEEALARKDGIVTDVTLKASPAP